MARSRTLSRPKTDHEALGVTIAEAIVKTLEEPLYRLGGIVGAIVSQWKAEHPPSETWVAQYAVGVGRRTCAVARRRSGRRRTR